MKKLILTTILVSLLLVSLVNVVSAQVIEQNYFKDDNDAPVNNVNVIGLVCSNADCSSVSGTLWGVLNSGDDYIELVYPTNLLSPFGYGVYMYKDGYVPWEVGILDWNGCAGAPCTVGPYDNYLTRKASCTSIIEDIDVSVVGQTIDVDVTVHAPIEHAGPLPYVPPAILDQYSTDVQIIVDVVGPQTYSDSQIINTEYSADGTVRFVFNVVPGTYTVTASTDVPDPKCMASASDIVDEPNIIVPGGPGCTDNDGDTYAIEGGACGAVDCNDNNANIYPDATEVCNGVDDDCDTIVDEGCVTCTDNDGDLYSIEGGICGLIDCDDNNANVNPGATESCSNLIDDDCDTLIDGADPDCGACTDGTTQSCGLQLGVCSGSFQTCTGGAWPGCTDTNYGPDYERIIEITCDGLDNDCDGLVDEGLTNTYYQDSDGDGYGDPLVFVDLCSAPAGYVADNTDCNDGDANVNPGVTEVCNGIDDNCDGSIDEGCPCTDGDTQACPLQQGVCSGSLQTCVGGVWATCNYGPDYEVTETNCDGLDNDCDGTDDEGCGGTDTLPPVINLISPLDGDVFDILDLISFIFTVSDQSGIQGCVVDVAGVGTYPNAVPISRTTQNTIDITPNLGAGDYSAKVECTDTAVPSNTGESDTILIIIRDLLNDVTAPIIDVIRPKDDKTYDEDIKFEITTNEPCISAWFSLDGESDVTMYESDSTHTRFYYNEYNLDEDDHDIIFCARDYARPIGNVGCSAEIDFDVEEDGDGDGGIDYILGGDGKWGTGLFDLDEEVIPAISLKGEEEPSTFLLTLRKILIWIIVILLVILIIYLIYRFFKWLF